MPPIIPQIVGICAVIAFMLSYIQKKRITIIIVNATASVLYVLQYILLGAFAGAVHDVFGGIITVVAGKKHNPTVKKFLVPIIILLNCAVIAVGVTIAVLNKSFIDLLPIFGVIFQNDAFFLTKENHIRIVSLIGGPFWLVYNFISHAYGATVGSILSMCFMIAGLIKYREKKENKSGTDFEESSLEGEN